MDRSNPHIVKPTAQAKARSRRASRAGVDGSSGWEGPMFALGKHRPDKTSPKNRSLEPRTKRNGHCRFWARTSIARVMSFRSRRKIVSV